MFCQTCMPSSCPRRRRSKLAILYTTPDNLNHHHIDVFNNCWDIALCSSLLLTVSFISSTDSSIFCFKIPILCHASAKLASFYSSVHGHHRMLWDESWAQDKDGRDHSILTLGHFMVQCMAEEMLPPDTSVGTVHNIGPGRDRVERNIGNWRVENAQELLTTNWSIWQAFRSYTSCNLSHVDTIGLTNLSLPRRDFWTSQEWWQIYDSKRLCTLLNVSAIKLGEEARGATNVDQSGVQSRMTCEHYHNSSL